MQTCHCCHTPKPESEYHVNGGKLARTCKDCVNTKRREKRRANRMEPEETRKRLNHAYPNAFNKLLTQRWT